GRRLVPAVRPGRRRGSDRPPRRPGRARRRRGRGGLMRLQGRRYAGLGADGGGGLEYWGTVMRLQGGGAGGVSGGPGPAEHRGKNGLRVQAEAVAADVDQEALDGLVIPGGWAPDKLRRDAGVVELVRSVHARGRPMGIICHGGLVAISAGIVRGARATGSLGIKDDLVNARAEGGDAPAFRDGQLVWGRGGADIPDLQRGLVARFAEG